MQEFLLGGEYTVHTPFQFEGRSFHPGDKFKTVAVRDKRQAAIRVWGCQFTHEFNGHSCEGRGEPKHCWWIREYMLLANAHGEYKEPAWEL